MDAWNGRVGREVDLKALIEEKRAASASFRRASDVLRASVEVSLLVARARAEQGLSQRQLAKLMGTSQAQVHRLETMGYGHSLDSVVLAAAALDRRLVITFEKLEGAGNPPVKSKAAPDSAKPLNRASPSRRQRLPGARRRRVAPVVAKGKTAGG